MQSKGNPNDADQSLDNNRPPIVQLEQRLAAQLADIQSESESITKNDRNFLQKDTVEVVVDLLARIKAAGHEINQQTEEVRERLYYLTFNATVMIFKLCCTLRKAGFAKQATHFLAFNILCLDNNLILTTVKYLDWRVLNYVELSRSYADMGAYKAASKVIEHGIAKALYSKKIEEQDPPVPVGTKDTLIEALRVLRTQELKFMMQNGCKAEEWKKKLEEVFSSNKYHRSLAIVECLSLNDVSNCHLLQRNAKHLPIKTECLKAALVLMKPDIELVKNALIQIHEKKRRDIEKRDKLASGEELNVDEVLDQYKKLDEAMIKEADWQFASKNVPLEVHVEVLKLCYEAQLWTEFDALLDPALVRLKFRRYETPFLATIDVQMSAQKISNIPNGFEKLPKDLNAANLKIELKKLRAAAKQSTADDDEDDEPAEKRPSTNTQEKAAPTKADPKKPDPKGKPDPKAAQQKGKPQPAAQPESKMEERVDEDGTIAASKKELELIQHIYVSMLLQRTKNPQNAIVGLDVILADEVVGPDLPDNHFAVAIPIRQHTGIYEKTKLIPYLVFRRTANSLIDEEDCLSVVTDVQILMGQDRHLRAPLGYTKIPVDLRQTPPDLERVHNLDYVFICYKSDKQLALTERDLLIMRRLAELERSYVPKTAIEYKQLSEEDRVIATNYNLAFLAELARTLRESLLGPLGDYYLEQRRDFLNDLSSQVYSTYLLPALTAIDNYIELRNQKELYTELVDVLDEHVIKVKNQFLEIFNVIHRVLSRQSLVDNIVFYSKFSVYYANLLEESGDFRNAVQSLRTALGKVVEYREARIKATIDTADSPSTSMTITTDNKKIAELEEKIRLVTNTWKESILRKERDRARRDKEELPLDEDEGDEEQTEVRHMIEELQNKDLFEKEIDQATWHSQNNQQNKILGKQFFSEQDQIVHALHSDLLVNLYRCEIKLGKEIGVVKTQTNKLLTTQGIDLSKHAPGNLTKNLSTTLAKKMDQTKTSKTLAGSKAALKELQQTLQEAGKLPPEKPQALNYERILEKENNQNPYQQALLYMSLAVAKSNPVSQKSLLLEAYEYIKKARASEESLAALLLENSIYVSASRHFHAYFNKSPNQVHPFNLMADNVYIKRTAVPQTPVMLGRTSTSITMKLPFYKPVTEYKAWRKIETVALYGKPSGSGVAVSLNNTDYPGTGDRLPQGHIVHVTGLIPNEKYVFACGGYTPDGVCVNGIGETSKEILTVLPLSIHQICGYLAEISFKLGKYEIAKLAAEEVCKEFIIKNSFGNFFLDSKVNPILACRLNTDYLRLISPIEAKQVAQAFCILAKTSQICKNEIQKRAASHEMQVERQKVDFRIANYYVLALEICTAIIRTNLIKRTVVELFNHLVSYLQMPLLTPLLLQVLVKCHQAMRLVPQDQMDSISRKVISCLSFQIMRLGFQSNETSLSRRILISELPINTRKWRKFVHYQIKRIEPEEKKPEVQLDKKGNPIKPAESKGKPDPKAAEAIAQSEVLSAEAKPEVKFVEERIVQFLEFESEGPALDEFLLSLGDYSDLAKAKLERWKLLINAFQKQITTMDEVEHGKEKLQGLVDFWEAIKTTNPVTQLNALILAASPPADPKGIQKEAAPSTENENKRYLEFVCKCVRRAMELPDTDFNELHETLTNKIKVDQSCEEGVMAILNGRIENLTQDIVDKQRRRFLILEEKVKQMLESRTLAGENKITAKALQKIMLETEHSIKQENMGKQQVSSQIIQHKSEELQTQRQAEFLWVSEKYFLQGICKFVRFSRLVPQRSVFDQSIRLNCIFHDIVRLEFSKFKSVLSEYQEFVAQRELSSRAKSAESVNTANRPVETPAQPTKQPPGKATKDKNQPVESAIPQEIVKLDDQARLQHITSFLEVMARASKFALNARAWLQLSNIVVYTWNAFSYDLTNPLELSHQPEAWKSVVIMAECSLFLLEFLQQGGKLRTQNSQQIDQVKNQHPSFSKEAGKTIAFKLESEIGEEDIQAMQADNNNRESMPIEEAKQAAPKNQKWWERVGEFDINMQVSFVAFAVQCLMSVKKWESMVDISNRLNAATENAFASQLLPFIIFAQTTLYQNAAFKTTDKRRELDVRVQAFENWKLTNKKKRSRQAMITGEIPPEEQEFLNDKAALEKEIFRLEVIENLLLTDKESSDTLFETLKRDANNCVESLKACRKLYYQFGTASDQLRQEEMQAGCFGVEHIQNAQIKDKRQSHRVFTNMVIASYKKTIDLLRKRQENFLLIQALHEIGNLHYADNNAAEAEVQWNDCVDTIFQKLYSVSHYREIFKSNPQLADSFGSKQVMIGGVVLIKLAKLCYEGKDMSRFVDCVLMATGMFGAPSKLSMPNAQNDICWFDQTPREFFGIGEDSLFADKQILQPSEVLHALQVLVQTLIDMDKSSQAMPAVSIMEYLAANVTKSPVLVTKARIWKAIACLNCGRMQQALKIFRRILDAKDLPKHGIRGSEFAQVADGANFHVDENPVFHNHLSPENEKNLAAIQWLLKPLEGFKLEQLKLICSPDVYEMIFYLRALFLFRVGETENVEQLDKADLRVQLLKASEEQLRQSLNRFAFNLQVLNIQNEITETTERASPTKDTDVQVLKDQLTQLFEGAATPLKDRRTMFENTEEYMCFTDRQSQSISFMLRSRSLLSTVFRKRGLLLESFYILRQGLLNFKLFAEGCIKGVENGQEPKEKGSFSLPEMFGGSAANASAKPGLAKAPSKLPEKAPAGKAPAKGAKAEAEEDALAREEEERKKQQALERERLRVKVEINPKRRHPHILLWLRAKMDLIRILMAQNRVEDVTDCLAVMKLECLSVKDAYFVRLINQCNFMLLVKAGETKQALVKGYEIMNYAKKHEHSDKDLAEFQGLFGELLYNIDKREEAVQMLREGRMTYWMKCRNHAIEIVPQNINQRTDIAVNADRKKPNEDVLLAFASQAPTGNQGKGGAGKPVDPKKAPPGKGQVPVSDDLPVVEDEEKVQLDFSKKVTYNLVPMDPSINSGTSAPNIYIPVLAQTIRFDIRYAQMLIMLQNKHEVAIKVLEDTDKLLQRTLYPNPQLRFYCSYMSGLANLNLFIEKALQFQSKYATQKKYKSSLADHIPQGFLALGEFMVELPNFSTQLRESLVSLLTTARACFERACQVGRAECILSESDFSLKDALLGLSKAHFYLGEYRARVLEYKYAPFLNEDEKRRLKNHKLKLAEEGGVFNDNLDSVPKPDKDKWEEIKQDKETLAVFNHKKAAAHYMKAAIGVTKSQREFLDKQHSIGTTNLTDPSKIPREIATELFEASQVNKVVHAKLPGFDFKDKTSISSGELLAYLRALIFETRLFTFSAEKERLSKLVCKLHRYLNSCLASYPARCGADFKDYVDLTSVGDISKSEIIASKSSLSLWFDFQTKKSQMFYILGPLDEAAVGLDPNTLEKSTKPFVPEGQEDPKAKGKQPPSKQPTMKLPTQPVEEKPAEPKEEKPPRYTRKQIAQIKAENQTIHFGMVEADPVLLSELHQDTCDLVDAMEASEKLSEACNERDRKLYQVRFEKLIDRLGGFYKPVLAEEQKDKEVDCLEKVREYLPPLTVDNVRKLAGLLKREQGCDSSDPFYNAILRQFHRVRYFDKHLTRE